MKVLGVIPARLNSSRLPEKVLADICGLPMVIHVYARAKLCGILDDVIVATDSELVKKVVEQYGGKAMMTSEHHTNCTERLNEVSTKVDADIYMLINGDEPLVRPEDIQKSCNLLKSDRKADASLLYVKITKFNSASDFKLVLNDKSHVMYISRGDIPSPLRNPVDFFFKAYHVMGFYKSTLNAYVEMEKPYLEKIEDHEHLRLLIYGKIITAGFVDYECFSVDTKSDLDWVRGKMPQDKLFQLYKDKR